MTDKPEKKPDSDLFLKAIGKVTPIKLDERSIVPTQKPKPFPQKKPPHITDKLSLANTESVDALHAEDTFSYIASGLQKNVLKKMRRGHYGLDAELDLHGLTAGSRYFCESLFWASQPKQAAKT